MSLEELHETAQKSTPQEISVPQTWGGLIVWAVGKWGVGIVFLGLLVPVYQDLKASNHQLAEISRANVEILTTLSREVAQHGDGLRRLEDTMDRIIERNPRQ